jgi:quercetin dioxygenase-like cupin family protein
MTSQFPAAKFYITKNSPDGKATFLDDAGAPTQSLGLLSQFSYIYSAPPSLDMGDDSDLNHHIATAKIQPMKYFPQHGGTACAIIDFAPNPEGEPGSMHKTKTLDYLVMLEGEMELELLGGEKRVVKKGEVVIQRECKSVVSIFDFAHRTCPASGTSGFPSYPSALKCPTREQADSLFAGFHSWKNVSKTEGARFLAVTVGGKGAVGGEMEIYTEKA